MKNLSILFIDRPLESGQNIVKDVFKVYGPKYELFVFPPKEDDSECRIQVVFFEYDLIREMEDLFPSVRIDYDPDDLDEFFDFDLAEIAQDVFYEVLETRYVLSVEKLSELGKNGPKEHVDNDDWDDWAEREAHSIRASSFRER